MLSRRQYEFTVYNLPSAVAGHYQINWLKLVAEIQKNTLTRKLIQLLCVDVTFIST